MATAILNLIPNYLRLRSDDAAGKLYLEWYNSAAGTWDIKEQWDADTGNRDVFGGLLVDLVVNKSIPAVQLQGTETDAKDLSIRENAGKTEIYDNGAGSVVMTLESHQARHASGGADAISGLAYTQFSADSIQLTVDIPMVADFAGATVAADATGTPAWPHTTVKVDSATIKHLKSAKLIVDYAWAATADGTIQLYDSTAAAVRGESTAKVGGESSAWEEFAVSGLVAGNMMVVRANVTAAGAAGETATLYRAILRLTLGVS